MDCWYPRTVSRHRNYRGKDNLVYSYVYGKLQVPCGRCPACRRRKQNEWAFRILEEAKYSKKTAFVTLTYDDDHLSFSDLGIPTLDKDRVHKFTKDLRYRIGQYRYFLCGEYGDDFDRPHYHMCLFYNGDFSHEQLTESILKCWQDGNIQYKPTLTAGRSKYVAKYSMKQIGFDYQDVIPPFARMSRRPGIGKLFLEFEDLDKLVRLNQWFVHDYQGTPYNLPRYYKERMYSKDQIEQHSLLLEKVKNYKFDYEKIMYDNDCNGSFFKNEMLRISSRERLFISRLKKENYGFRYKPYKPKEYERADYGSDLVTDEF